MNYFIKQVDELIRVSGVEMERIIHTREAIEEDVIVQISGELKRICAMTKEKSDQLSTENFFDQFNNLVRSRLQPDSSKWIPWYNEDDGYICLFSFGLSPGYAEKEVRLSRTFEWTLFLQKIERDLSSCEKTRDVPRNIATVEQLVKLLSILDDCKICDGCGDAEDSLFKNSGGNLYRTKDGENAVLIDNDKARSTRCHLLVPRNVTHCPMCIKSRHYLRTLKSRRKSEKKRKTIRKSKIGLQIKT